MLCAAAGLSFADMVRLEELSLLDGPALLAAVQGELAAIQAKKDADASLNRPWTKQVCVCSPQSQSGPFLAQR